MEERNKYLTEAMGECWHDFTTGIDYCEKESQVTKEDGSTRCGAYKYNPQDRVSDFTTWTGFGKLWEWAREQEWWKSFIYDYTDDYVPVNIPCSLINPTTFAEAVYKHLKGE